MVYRFAIVEDEPLSVRLLTEYLGQLDKVDLVIATNNLSEVELLIVDCQLDLVLLDINIKGVDLEDIARLLKRDCRFIIVTAYPFSQLQAIAPGPDHGYLSKPVSFIRFRLEVRKILGASV
jgi:response regulator of citrate/malate metabolism